MTDEVIVIARNWQVFTFDNITKAKAILMRELHPMIIPTAVALAQRYNVVELRTITYKSLCLDRQDITINNMVKLNDHNTLAALLWPMLVAHGRKTVQMAFNRGATNVKHATRTMYYCDYIPGEDPALDLNYIKMPPQARALADLFSEKIQPMGKGGVPEHVFIKLLNEYEGLTTHQRPWRIWCYYKKQLIARGFIDVKEP